MNARTPPPRGLGWADGYPARLVALVLAVISILVSIWVGLQYVGYVNCLRTADVADKRRTAAIATATDVERRADLALLAGVQPGGPTVAQMRAADIAARVHTDQVRAANPAPAAATC